MKKFNQFLSESSLGFMPKNQARYWYKQETDIGHDSTYEVYPFNHDKAMRDVHHNNFLFLKLKGGTIWYRCWPNFTGMYTLTVADDSERILVRIENLTDATLVSVTRTFTRIDKNSQRIETNLDRRFANLANQRHVYSPDFTKMMLDSKIAKIVKKLHGVPVLRITNGTLFLDNWQMAEIPVDKAQIIYQEFDKMSRETSSNINRDYRKLKTISKFLDDLEKKL